MSLSKYSGPRAKEMLVLSSGERSAPRRKGLIGRSYGIAHDEARTQNPRRMVLLAVPLGFRFFP